MNPTPLIIYHRLTNAYDHGPNTLTVEAVAVSDASTRDEYVYQWRKREGMSDFIGHRATFIDFETNKVVVLFDKVMPLKQRKEVNVAAKKPSKVGKKPVPSNWAAPPVGFFDDVAPESMSLTQANLIAQLSNVFQQPPPVPSHLIHDSEPEPEFDEEHE